MQHLGSFGVRKFSHTENISNQQAKAGNNNILTKNDDSNLDGSSNKATIRSVRRTIQLSQDFSLNNAKQRGESSETTRAIVKEVSADLKAGDGIEKPKSGYGLILEKDVYLNKTTAKKRQSKTIQEVGDANEDAKGYDDSQNNAAEKNETHTSMNA